MYRVIGADQKEYGPVSADQLRSWIAEGRANARTLIQPEGTVGWKPVSDFVEFAPALAQAGPPPYPSPALSMAPTDNNMAAASLIFGCLSVVCCQPLSIVGVILGIVALVQMKSDPTKGGRGMAIAGIAVSVASMLIIGALAALGLLSDIVHKIFQ